MKQSPGLRQRLAPIQCVLPLLTAILSVTTLAVVNAERGISPSDLALPAVLSLLVGAIAWLFAGLVVRENSGRAVLAAVIAFFVLMGGRLIDALPLDAAYHPAVTFTWIFGALVTAVGLRRGAIVVPWPFVRFAIVACVILLGLQLPQMGGLLWTFGAGERAEVEIAPIEPSAQRPNIYFFLLDSYTGPRTLKSRYGLDLQPFNEALEELGFEVAERSHANYTQTFIALSSMLEMDYPTRIFDGLPPGSTDRAALYRMMHVNRATDLVRAGGYEIAFYRSSWSPLRRSPAADVHWPSRGASDFEVAWFSQSIFPALWRQRCTVASCREPVGRLFAEETARRFTRTFAAVSGTADSDRPYFHYIHLLLPHEPFVFKSDCSIRGSAHMSTLPDATPEPEKIAMYVEQVQCLNRLVLETVQHLKGGSLTPPVIILQSDHGHGLIPGNRPPPLDLATPDQVANRLDVFAAYHVPSASDSITYPGITPVNAMRRVFSEVFGLDLPPIPDQSYWSSFEDPYDFTLVKCPAEGRAALPC